MCHTHTFTHTRAYNNNVYTQDISKVTPKHKEDKWPPLRMGQHVACCLGFNTDNPHLLISGGRLEKQHLPYKDMWLLNSTSWTWREVSLMITIIAAQDIYTIVWLLSA